MWRVSLMGSTTEFRFPALEVRQGPQRILYSFAADGKKLSAFATISRIKREAGGDIQGYQRPEVLSHIAEIRRYLESSDPMIPNAIVIAFDRRVRFEPHGTETVATDNTCRAGTLIVPVE